MQKVFPKFLVNENCESTTPQTHHVYFTLKRRGNNPFHVVSRWNTCGVFVGHLLLGHWNELWNRLWQVRWRWYVQNLWKYLRYRKLWLQEYVCSRARTILNDRQQQTAYFKINKKLTEYLTATYHKRIFEINGLLYKKVFWYC